MMKTVKQNIKKMLLIFNHDLGQDQIEDAEVSLGVENFVAMPAFLKKNWGQIPAEAKRIEEFVMPVKEWIKSTADKGDVILIQGDFGATCLLVSYAWDLELIPVYATTRRRAEEIPQADGTMKMIHVFKHVQFRRYTR